MSAVAFRYRAVDREGLTRRGSLSAGSRQEAFRKISSLGLTPVLIEADAKASRPVVAKARAKDIAHFSYQLSVLLTARIPISDGLMSIAEQERDPKLRQVISDIAVRIESGEPLAESLAAHGTVFGRTYIETVRAAERSGNLIQVLDHLAEMLERTAESERQVRSACMYPACVLVVLGVAVLFLVGIVIPKFAGIFESRGAELPALTKALLLAGRSLQSYWYAYAAAAAGGVVAVRLMRRAEGSKALVDGMLHRVPVLKDLMMGLALSRFCHVFGLTLSSGLALTDCLELAGHSANRPMMLRDVRLLVEHVRKGGKLSEMLRQCPSFTPFSRRMLSVGEESAELTRMCSVVAKHYDRETLHLAKSASTLIEPILVVVIAAVVLVIALAIFLPMWDMVNLVK